MEASPLITGFMAILGGIIGAVLGARFRDVSKRREGAIAALPEYYASAATVWYVSPSPG